MGEEARPLAIIGFGKEHRHHSLIYAFCSDFSKNKKGHQIRYLDLQQELNDPHSSMARVSHGVDGRDQSTICAVYAQSKFPKTIIRSVGKVVDDEQRLKETYVTSNQSAALSSGSRLQICLLDASLAIWRSIS